MVICIEAGLGLDAAIVRLAGELRRGNPILGGELLTVAREVQAGIPRRDALKQLAERTGVAELVTLAAILAQSDRLGHLGGAGAPHPGRVDAHPAPAAGRRAGGEGGGEDRVSARVLHLPGAVRRRARAGGDDGDPDVRPNERVSERVGSEWNALEREETEDENRKQRSWLALAAGALLVAGGGLGLGCSNASRTLKYSSPSPDPGVVYVAEQVYGLDDWARTPTPGPTPESPPATGEPQEGRLVRINSSSVVMAEGRNGPGADGGEGRHPVHARLVVTDAQMPATSERTAETRGGIGRSGR